jgi:hypothetical protein
MQGLYEGECGYEFWVDESMEGGESSIFEYIIPSFAWDNEENSRKMSG